MSHRSVPRINDLFPPSFLIQIHTHSLNKHLLRVYYEPDTVPGAGDTAMGDRKYPCPCVQHHSSKASILQHSAFFTVQLSHPYMTTGKTIALNRRTFVGKVMSLLLNMLSRLVITFLPRSKVVLWKPGVSPFHSQTEHGGLE